MAENDQKDKKVEAEQPEARSEYDKAKAAPKWPQPPTAAGALFLRQRRSAPNAVGGYNFV